MPAPAVQELPAPGVWAQAHFCSTDLSSGACGRCPVLAARLLTLVGLAAGADRLSLCCIQQAQCNDFISFKLRNLLEGWKASYKVQVKWKTLCVFCECKKQGSGLAVWKALEWFKLLYKIWLCSYCHFHLLEDVFNYKRVLLQLEMQFLTNIKQYTLEAEV